MSELVMEVPAAIPLDTRGQMRKTRRGKIKIGARNRSGFAIKLTASVLMGLTVCGFLTFNYQNIHIGEAALSTLGTLRAMFLQPHLTYNTLGGSLWQLLIAFSLGALSTVFGAIIAVFGALLCAKNIANPRVANIMKSFIAFIRAVPTILWVLIFAASSGLGSVAAVVGLTFHSASYLIKAYAESIEEMDAGAIEALKASGASYWQIVFQAVFPASVTYMIAWTFLRFEINFANAVAVGAAAGAGGIGYDLYMASGFYFDPHELGFITYIIVISVIILEQIATKIKAKVR